jgi:hypothetical protein
VPRRQSGTIKHWAAAFRDLDHCGDGLERRSPVRFRPQIAHVVAAKGADRLAVSWAIG